jgi:Zn-dependent peptidase ImmA (M78 family)
MDSLRRREIEARAEVMLDDAQVTDLPIDPISIARQQDIQVTAKPPEMAGASGWLIRVKENYGIVYATHIDSIGFQHFSVAHELGHFAIDGHFEHVFRGGSEHQSRAGFQATDAVEREADYFAACLLMPKKLCRPLINRSQDGLAAVINLANACNTSLTAAALRYAEIGRLPVGVIQCLEGKVEFCATYPLQAHVGWARPLMRNAKVPVNSATRRLSEDADAILRSLEDSDSSEAYDWFPGADRNAGLIEEAIGLGRFGRTLTVLTLDPEHNADDDEVDDRWEEPRFR